jgi:hypothetical protein
MRIEDGFGHQTQIRLVMVLVFHPIRDTQPSRTSIGIRHSIGLVTLTLLLLAPTYVICFRARDMQHPYGFFKSIFQLEVISL